MASDIERMTDKSLARMHRLRELVRKDRIDVATAAAAVGCDPIIASLWLRLPDDFWPQTAEEWHKGRDVFPPLAPSTHPLRRVVAVRMPTHVYDRFRVANHYQHGLREQASFTERLSASVERGLIGWQDAADGATWETLTTLTTRWVRTSATISAISYTALCSLADSHFDGDVSEAAAWCLLRGAGFPHQLPRKEQPVTTKKIWVQVEVEDRVSPYEQNRLVGGVDIETAREALRELATFQPHDILPPLWLVTDAEGPAAIVGNRLTARAEVNPMWHDGDEDAPFFSEAVQYALLDKEDARTLLGRVRTLCTALGLDFDRINLPLNEDVERARTDRR